MLAVNSSFNEEEALSYWVLLPSIVYFDREPPNAQPLFLWIGLPRKHVSHNHANSWRKGSRRMVLHIHIIRRYRLDPHFSEPRSSTGMACQTPGRRCPCASRSNLLPGVNTTSFASALRLFRRLGLRFYRPSFLWFGVRTSAVSNTYIISLPYDN